MKKHLPQRKSSSENNKDRFSDLPDSIIHHILDFLNSKHAFQTCVLSTRWNHLTKTLPTLRLYPSSFNSFDSFTESMSQILSVRDDSTPLHTLDLGDLVGFHKTQVFTSFAEYAVSHHVQILRITVTSEFPSCLFSSQTLTSLDLNVNPCVKDNKILFPHYLNLPSLTTLALRFFYFGAGDDGCVDPFSVFKRLNTLIIEEFTLLDAQILCISSTTLVNFTMDGYAFCHSEIYICKLSTPNLCNFAFTGPLTLKPWRGSLSSVKHFYIDACTRFDRPAEEYSARLFNWLVELANVKSLTVSSNTLQVLSFLPDLFKLRLSSLCNLESLQVKMKPLATALYKALRAKFMKEGAKFDLKTNTFIPNGVVDFLIQNSPPAKVEII